MAKKKTSPAEDLIYIFSAIIAIIIALLIKLLTLIYYLVIFILNKYKEKSDLSFFKVYFNKGNFGEFKLFLKLKKHNEVENMFVNTYLIHNGNTDETEIDVLTVNNFGIFVFEMKNYSGKIYGNSNSKTWSQYLGKKKYPFYNPFRQNYAHTKALENVIPEYIQYIKPIVVFSNRCKVDKVTLNDNHILKKLKNVNSLINKKSVEVLNDDQILEIVNKIKEVSLNKSEVQEKHITQVKMLQED